MAINTEGVRSEATTGSPILNLAHGLFSAGVVAGSVVAGVLRTADAGATLVLGVLGALLAVVAVALARSAAAGPATPPAPVSASTLLRAR